LRSALLALLLAGATARADRCRDLEALGEDAMAAHLEQLRVELGRERRDLTIWHASWSTIYAGLATWQAVGVATGDTSDRRVYAFGLSGSLLGLAVLLVRPPSLLRDGTAWMRAPVGCAAILEAERVRARAVADEAFAKGPLVHVGNFVVNIGLALGLGVGFGDWDHAALQGGVGILVGEVQTFTRPGRLRRGGRPRPSLVPMLGPRTGGAALAGAF
jgi:hypothetical protein